MPTHGNKVAQDPNWEGDWSRACLGVEAMAAMEGKGEECEFGVFGMGTMGQNLALNVASRGFVVAAYNRPDEFQDRVWGALERAKQEGEREGVKLSVVPFTDVSAFVKSLAKPRRVLLSIPAGKAVDDTIESMLPYLDENDVVIDGGNEFFENTERRAKALMEKKRIHLVGMGISGGASGARRGPSLMPGCTPHAWQALRPVLESMSAKVEGRPMVTHVGLGGAGHFVKMVHNGIEYAEMQFLAEAYALLRAQGMGNEEMGSVFRGWNEDGSDLQSYLMEISSKILSFPDDRPQGGDEGYLIDKVLDAAGSKGTGKWTVQCAADLGIAAPCISAALEARFVSSDVDLRRRMQDLFSSVCPAPPTAGQEMDGEGEARPKLAVQTVADALLFARICAYAQGLHVIHSANQERGWGVDLTSVASVWQGGCIIRAKLLEVIVSCLKESPSEANLLLIPEFAKRASALQHSAREVVVHCVLGKIAAPALCAAVTYYDGIGRARGPANLIQAQRDYFGAHTYARLDAEGKFHTEWS